MMKRESMTTNGGERRQTAGTRTGMLPRILVAGGLSLLFLLGAVPATAQQVDICINFAGSGIPPVTQGVFVAKVQAHFNGAGLGAGGAQSVVIHNAAAPPAGGCDMNTGFNRLLLLPPLLGKASKKTHTAAVNPLLVGLKFPGKANAARRCQAMADVMAHEIGHMLCATHQCKGKGKKTAKLPLIGPVVLKCQGAATLMSTGKCIACADLGIGPGAGGLTFNGWSIAQMRFGLLAYGLGFRNWDLHALYFDGIVTLVEGVTHLQSVDIGADDEGYPINDVITFSYDTSGHTDLFELGWINEDGVFVEPVPEVDNPERLLEAPGGTTINFAIRGREDTAYEGQVFTFEDHGKASFDPDALVPAGSASFPTLSGSYHSRVTLDFAGIPGLFGNALSVHLDTGEWGDTNGFYLADEPIGGSGGCCHPSGSCVDGSTARECATFGGSYVGDGSTCGSAVCPAPLPTGACTPPGDACINDISLSMCDDLGGSFAGTGSTCATGGCVFEESCAEHTELECILLEGSYLGDGESCLMTACSFDGEPCSSDADCCSFQCMSPNQDQDSGGGYCGG